MVFSNLPYGEKQAFFDLLDEYFSSRPELLNGLGANSASTGLDKKAAYSAVHSALASNPDATANLVSAGLKHGSQNSSVKNSAFANAAANPEIANSIGRVAAASLAFGQRNTPPAPAPRSIPPAPAPRATPPPPAPRAVPPTLPRRTSSQAEQEQEESEEAEDSRSLSPPGRPPAPMRKTSGASNLKSGKSFGNVDTSSWVGGISSLAHKNKKTPSVAPVLPPAFPKRQTGFPPPPPRRTTSGSLPPAASPEPEPEPEPEEDGEWAEALYEYNSGEGGDLVINAQDRIRVVSKDSDDWWTGEVNGKTGLFPVSYVKLL